MGRTRHGRRGIRAGGRATGARVAAGRGPRAEKRRSFAATPSARAQPQRRGLAFGCASRWEAPTTPRKLATTITLGPEAY